ncbi:MAG: site-specific integrase [Sphingomonadaceae bacterium]
MPANFKSISPSILNRHGKRKYLTIHEREKFLQAAQSFREDIFLLCELITATGCRISEALALMAESVDFDSGVLVVECLKKRRKGVYREIPLPPNLLLRLQQQILDRKLLPESRIWQCSRTTAYRNICSVMEKAGVVGEHASPKGLRHGFAVAAIQAGVPLNLVQRWLGHADMSTTAIYANASGPEERSIASRMWSQDTDFKVDREAPRPAETDSVSFGHYTERIRYEIPETDPAHITQLQHFGASIAEETAQNSTCPVLHFWLKCNKLLNLDTIDFTSAIEEFTSTQSSGLTAGVRQRPATCPEWNKLENRCDVPSGTRCPLDTLCEEV